MKIFVICIIVFGTIGISFAESCDLTKIKKISIKLNDKFSDFEYIGSEDHIETITRSIIARFKLEWGNVLETSLESSKTFLSDPYLKTLYKNNIQSLKQKEFSWKSSIEQSGTRTRPRYSLEIKSFISLDDRDTYSRVLKNIAFIGCGNDIDDLVEKLNTNMNYGELKLVKGSIKRKKIPAFYEESNDGSLSTNDILWPYKITNFFEAQNLLDNKEQSYSPLISFYDTGLLCHPQFCFENEVPYIESSIESLSDEIIESVGNLGHGTRVFGLLFRREGDREIDLPALASNARVKVKQIGSSITLLGKKKASVLAEKLDEDIEENNADIISLSAGGLFFRTRAVKNKINKLYHRGVIVVAAGGNRVPFMVAPAVYDETIAVTACAIDGDPSPHTARGKKADICAPGKLVTHPRPIVNREEIRRGEVNEFEFDYIKGNGTSLATPFITAAAFLWLSYHGKENLRTMYSKGCYIVEAFRRSLKESATPFHSQSYTDKERYGAGFVNYKNLLLYPLPSEQDLTCY